MNLLAPYPRLEGLFRPFAQYIRQGDLAGFDTALAAGENEFVKRRIYLTLERGRDITLRNLFRKVYMAGGFDEAKEGQPSIRRTRIPVSEFEAALRLGNRTGANEKIDSDEVECLLANMIYKVFSPSHCSFEIYASFLPYLPGTPTSLRLPTERYRTLLSIPPLSRSRLTLSFPLLTTELYEGLHCPRARHGRAKQGRVRLPRDWSLNFAADEKKPVWEGHCYPSPLSSGWLHFCLCSPQEHG